MVKKERKDRNVRLLKHAASQIMEWRSGSYGKSAENLWAQQVMLLSSGKPRTRKYQVEEQG
jgi:hypothetical protein